MFDTFSQQQLISVCSPSDSNFDLSNPDIPPPEVDTSLVKLYDEIRITVRKEAGIISAVFPQPATVMQVFLQRIFAQSVTITRYEGFGADRKSLTGLARSKIMSSCFFRGPSSIPRWRTCERLRLFTQKQNDSWTI